MPWGQIRFLINLFYELLKIFLAFIIRIWVRYILIVSYFQALSRTTSICWQPIRNYHLIVTILPFSNSVEFFPSIKIKISRISTYWYFPCKVWLIIDPGGFVDNLLIELVRAENVIYLWTLISIDFRITNQIKRKLLPFLKCLLVYEV